ncbi:hypothetical protein CH063_06858 [Colletotrichum higginsianum]|uniref:Uncharacterized protein n=1 Tax=Colletotrichum higginsianum (strain IMI 349063) TaxID=759273 RepID=H1V432_COLHI|nr:hypothetical protein CH063_06858 [Colletotrichum higginsianum]
MWFFRPYLPLSANNANIILGGMDYMSLRVRWRGFWHLHCANQTLAYYYITWGIWLRRCLEGRENEYRLVWPRSLSSIPLVVRRGKAE